MVEVKKPKTQAWEESLSLRYLTKRVLSPWFLAFGLTFALYWRILSFPFFWDDVPHFITIASRTFGEIWTNLAGYGYYRPAIFTLYRLAFNLLHLPPVCFYTFALMVHATTGALAGKLAGYFVSRESARPLKALWGFEAAEWATGLGSLLFVTYPFAVLPVANVASVMHLVVASCALGATLAGLYFIEEPKWIWLALTLLLAGAAPYFHESGVMVGAIVSLAILIKNRWAAWQYKWLIGLLFILDALFVVIWFNVPKPSAPKWVGWESIGASFSFFAQGLTYPFQPLATWLISQKGWWDLGAIWFIALPTLLIAAVILLRRQLWRPFLLAVGWFGLAIAPSLFALPFSYVFISMRLLYAVAAPAALLWSTLCIAIASRSDRPHLSRLVGFGVAGFAALIPAFFIQREISLHQIALTPVWQLAKIAREYPTERHLIIDPLEWLAYADVWYPLGHEGYLSPPSMWACLSWPQLMLEFMPSLKAISSHRYRQRWITMFMA